MKPAVLFLTVLGCVGASPNGYYHQEYNYKSSASSYKNNELQHQTDDQGYYKKDGDLEGRVRPRVDANSEHSEYVNPNLRPGDHNSGYVAGANGDLSSYGHLSASSGTYGAHGLSSEGLAHSNRIGGSAGAYSGYSSGSYGSNSYGVSSNLQSVTSHIQQELERELQRAIEDNRAYSQSAVSVSELERDLRRNLTQRLNQELANRYGQQSIKGGLSYTISDGRLQSTANYDNQELQDLRRQLENTLLNNLRSQYSRSDSYYQSQQTAQGSSYGYTTTVRPVYNTHYQAPYRPHTPNYIQYTPVSNPESITTIASTVQNQLDSRLNDLLEDVQRRYFSSSSSYSLTNTDVILENLRNDLRNNITYLLNENVKANYGNQIPRDGYMYSVGTNGQTSSQYNYSVRDLENLRTQIERNLIEKLNRDFETHRSRWHQQSQSQSSHSSVHYGGYSTPRYDIYTTPRYTYDSNAEHYSPGLSSSHIGVKGGSSNRRFNLLAGSSHGGYEITGSGGSSASGNIAQLQSQLQQDLSRQLQAALSKSQYGSYSVSSGSYNPQSYQTSYQQLSDELNRNLTRQLQEYSSSAYYSTYGNVDQSQLDSLRSQLQSNLLRQLQQGLQQSYQSSSSYSASSSSGTGSYRPVRGFDNYHSGQFQSGAIALDGADCAGDDPNAYNSHRMKRSYQPYRSQPLGLGHSSNHRGYTPNYSYSGSLSYGTNQQQELGQQEDESDLTQQVQEPALERFQQGSLSQQQVDLGQQVDDSELTQESENPRLARLQLGSQSQQVELGQQVDDSELTQQVEDSGIGRVQLGSQSHQQVQLGQQVDDSELTQQVVDSGIGQWQLGSQRQQQVEFGQETDDFTQQAEHPRTGRLQIGAQSEQQVQLGQQVDDYGLTQQVEDSNVGKLQLGSQQEVQLGQQVDDYGLTQQVEDSNVGKLLLGSQSQQQVQLGQQVDDSELTQQVEDSGVGTIQLGSQRQVELTQQAENSNSGKLQLVSSGQANLRKPVNNLDLTQQVEDETFGKLHLGSQNQQIDQSPQIGSSEIDDLSSGKLQTQQQDQLRQEADNSDLTQQSEQVNVGHSQFKPLRTHYSDLTHQGERAGSLKPVSTPQNHHHYGQPQISNFGQSSQTGQLEDNSDLTQQVQDAFEASQQTEDLGGYNLQIREQHSFRPHQTGGNRDIYTGSNFNQNQKQIAQQIKNDLSQQISDAVRTSDRGNSQLNYQNLLRELQRNITKQLEALTPTSGSTRYQYTYSFSAPQINYLQNQLENDLKWQLEKEISIVGSNDNTGRQQTNQVQQGGRTDVVQQQENNFKPLDLGEQTQTRDDAFGPFNPQTGNGQINQPLRVGHGQQTHLVDTQTSDQLQQVEDVNMQLSHSNNNQYHRHHFSRPHSTGSSQFGNRPKHQRPIDNSHFINTEIAQQQNLYPSQDITSQQNVPLPSLNQVIQQQHSTPQGGEGKGEINIEPLSLQTGQQEETEFTDEQQHQQNVNFSPQTSETGRGDVTESNLSFHPNEPSSTGQIINNQNLNKPNDDINQVHPESRADAERDADLLLETLRESLRNRDSQSASAYGSANINKPTYAQVVGEGSQDGQQQVQTNFYGSQDSYQKYLNNRQVQLALQLQSDISKQLEDAISRNYYTMELAVPTTLGTQVIHQTNYEELLKDLRKNITKELEEIYGTRQTGYFTNSNDAYSLSQDQKEQLIGDLTQKLTREFHISGSHQHSEQTAFNSRVIHSSHGSSSVSGSNEYNAHGSHQIHYGHQNVLPDSESVSELKPITPEHPTVVQNVPQQPNYNIGVKGSRRFRVSSTPASSLLSDSEVQSPLAEQVVPVQVNPPAGEVTDLNKTPESETQEELPWWKRLGNKIKHGAGSLKEKIIG